MNGTREKGYIMDYLALAKSVVAQAGGDGIEVEVYITQDKETSIKVNRGEVTELSQAGSGGMGVRVIERGRMGYAYTSDLSDEAIAQTWRTARELARIATADEYRALPDPQPVDQEDLGIWDERLAKVSISEKIAKIKAVEQAAYDYDPRIIATAMCQYGDNVSHVYLANSKGFAGEYGRTAAYALMLAVARGEDGSMMNAFGVGASTFFDELSARAIGEESASKSVRMLGGKPVSTQIGTVVLDHFVGAQILMALAAALTAEAWQKRRSFLMDKMGATIGNDKVTLLDNGRLKGGFASAPFDGEGVPTSATRLVDEGVLQNLIYDTYSARKAGRASTGNSQRGDYRALPSLGPSNFYIQPGQKSREDIIAGVERGLYVLSVMQTGGIDPITGDCSMGANGLWIENGQVVGPVNGVTIATTLSDFLNNISEVGNDMRMIPFGGVIGVPTLRVDNVTIGGTRP